MNQRKKTLIAPSILSCDMARIGEEVRAVEKAGADVIHLDIMDGHFVPNITIGFPVIKSLRKVTKLPFDAHLMIDDADRYIDDFAAAGCNWISVHIEACRHINRTLARIRDLGMRPGIAIDPGTSLSILDAALEDADFVLIMSVNPGFGGQEFIPASIERVRQLKKMIGDRPVQIEIDGGIKEHNIGEVVAVGADIIVVGSGIFSAKDYGARIKKLRGEAR